MVDARKFAMYPYKKSLGNPHICTELGCACAASPIIYYIYLPKLYSVSISRVLISKKPKLVAKQRINVQKMGAKFIYNVTA